MTRRSPDGEHLLADSMMPEAFEHGGKSVGLLTVLGYLAAAGLTAVG